MQHFSAFLSLPPTESNPGRWYCSLHYRTVTVVTGAAAEISLSARARGSPRRPVPECPVGLGLLASQPLSRAQPALMNEAVREIKHSVKRVNAGLGAYMRTEDTLKPGHCEALHEKNVN